MELAKRVQFETEWFLLLDKPTGISVHKDEGEFGLVTALSKERGEPLWLVHRLDKLTSGALLLARTQEAAAELSACFRDRKVDKLYLALSHRKPKRKQGQIRGDMERSRGGGWRLSRQQHNPAITEFTSSSVAEGLRLFLCHPITGKTHQIRVALKSEGAPIVGDTRYEQRSAESAERGYLHAWQLGFTFREQKYALRVEPSEGALFTMPSVKEGIERLAQPQCWPTHWKLPLLADGMSNAV